MLILTHLVVAATLIVAAGDVPAAQQKRADELIQKGNELRRRGDNYGAFDFFKQAHEISPTPRTAAQLGLAEQATGRWADAELHLTTALADTQNVWIKRNREVLRQALEDAHVHVGRVEIVGDPPSAVVMVNAKRIGTLPLKEPVAVNAGNVDIEVSAEGYVTERRSMSVPAQQVQTVVFRLKPVAVQTPPLLTGPGPAPEAETTLAISPVEEGQPRDRTWLWVGVGAAVAVAAIAGIMLATSKDEYPKPNAEVSW